MISDSERRKVAARLRQMADAHRSVETSRVARALGLEYEVYGTVVAFNGAAVQALADLIDPTCEMTPQGEGFRCSACGTHHDMSGFKEFPWPRCPECGARVKGSNSMPLGDEGR